MLKPGEEIVELNKDIAFASEHQAFAPAGERALYEYTIESLRRRRDDLAARYQLPSMCIPTIHPQPEERMPAMNLTPQQKERYLDKLERRIIEGGDVPKSARLALGVARYESAITRRSENGHPMPEVPGSAPAAKTLRAKVAKRPVVARADRDSDEDAPLAPEARKRNLKAIAEIAAHPALNAVPEAPEPVTGARVSLEISDGDGEQIIVRGRNPRTFRLAQVIVNTLASEVL